ncbi:MAG: 30S ribosomal protein S2, partial [Patescibacteria group bacterium]|nr:30S ribosomal protein S2 [Patescibacteria group bacterium]
MSDKKEAAVKKDDSKKVVEKEQAKNVQPKRKNIFDDYDYDSLELTMPALLKAGVHFGHQKSRRNPKMDDYIFTTRNNINIIDLAKTVTLTQEALDFLASVGKSGKKILFVGTKKQAHDLVVDAAEYTDNLFVVERWL